MSMEDTEFTNMFNTFLEMTKKYCEITMNYCNNITKNISQQKFEFENASQYEAHKESSPSKVQYAKPSKNPSKKTQIIDALLKKNKKTYTFGEIKQIWWNLNSHKPGALYKNFNIICHHMNPTFAQYPKSGSGYLCRPSKSEPRYIKKLGYNTYTITDEPMKLIYN